MEVTSRSHSHSLPLSASSTRTRSGSMPPEMETIAQRPASPALVVVWSRLEPELVGSVLLVPRAGNEGVWTFGRTHPTVSCDEHRLKLYRQLPGKLESTYHLKCDTISKEQLRIRIAENALEIENCGKRPMRYREAEVKNAQIAPGDLLELKGELLLFCTLRPSLLPLMPSDLSASISPFGEPDPHGIVGESPAVWELRRQIAFYTRSDAHVLIQGDSGTGKELAAQAIHRGSSRHTKPMVSCSAAALPEGLIDAELFGNIADYPQRGMAERPGLVGASDGSTLFLDEFGELPTQLQAHLLRVLDNGEYHRLGESASRRADFRLIAATNRPEGLKHDIAARLSATLELPGLNERREDIPLLVRHLLHTRAKREPAIADRYFMGGDRRGEPRVSLALMQALMLHRYSTHVREISKVLDFALRDSPGNTLELTHSVARNLQEDPLLSKLPGGDRAVSISNPDAAVVASQSPDLRAKIESLHKARETPRPESSISTTAPTVELPAHFSDQDRHRLRLLRRHRFNEAACARDSEYASDRGTVHRHVRVLIAKALYDHWSPERATAMLSGLADPALRETISGRIQSFAGSLRVDLSANERDTRKRYGGRYGSDYFWLEHLIEAILTGEL